jgi:CHAT domain-containing protein
LDGRKAILIAPDAQLNLLPFETLPLAAGRYLIDDYQVSYLTCGRDVLRFGMPRFGECGQAVVIADPAFNLAADAASAAPAQPEAGSRQAVEIDRGLRFGPLKGTRQESEEISKLLGITPWLRADALAGRVKTLRSPRILHLATHGFFLATEAVEGLTDVPGRLSGQGMKNPLLRSGLALAGANVWLGGGSVPPEAEGGLLTAEDVTGMDLLDTDLVVLSACETGLGEIQFGEGVLGLRRAFVLAGTRRLVMSLWKVPDAQTKELMIDFYQRILRGDGVAQALRGAQLALKVKHPDAYYWGAFVCLGDTAALALPIGR